jgi:hypothetical protein
VLLIFYAVCLVYLILAGSVSENPSFLSDLASMLIIALNYIFTFLDAGHAPKFKSHDCRKPPAR